MHSLTGSMIATAVRSARSFHSDPVAETAPFPESGLPALIVYDTIHAPPRKPGSMSGGFPRFNWPGRLNDIDGIGRVLPVLRQYFPVQFHPLAKQFEVIAGHFASNDPEARSNRHGDHVRNVSQWKTKTPFAFKGSRTRLDRDLRPHDKIARIMLFVTFHGGKSGVDNIYGYSTKAGIKLPQTTPQTPAALTSPKGVKLDELRGVTIYNGNLFVISGGKSASNVLQYQGPPKSGPEFDYLGTMIGPGQSIMHPP